MKFKLWLYNLEENQRNNTQAGNQLGTDGLGPTSQYGRRALLPISRSWDNRAVAGVIDGVGEARAKIRARDGAEPGVASQYQGLEDIRRDGLEVLYMPLQLPSEYSGQAIRRSRGLINSLKWMFGDTTNDVVWRVESDNNIRLKSPDKPKSTQLYVFVNNEVEDENKLSSAIEYTEALMMASISVKLKKYSHLINTDNLDRPKDRKIETVPAGGLASDIDGGKDDDDIKKYFYKVMMCSFVLKSLHNGQHIDADMRDELADVLAGRTPKPRTTPAPQQQDSSPSSNP
jgi:hypothetical protein